MGVAVTIKALDLQWGSWGSGYLNLSIDGLNGYQTVSAYAYDAETAQMTARLEPGKTYFLDVSSDDLGDLTIQAAPPPGYVMEIERIARERLVLGYGGPTSVRLRVRAPFQEYAARGGTATALTSGRVFWQAALGSLSNGASAGALAIIDTGTGTTDWADLFSPAGFSYEHTSSEVEVVYNPRNVPPPYIPGTIRQILAPEACADVVVTSPTQAEVKFYHRAQLQAYPSSGIRSFSGAPFAWYLINQDGSQPNKAYINCDLRDVTDLNDPNAPLVHVKHTVLERTGSAPNFTWTADEWYDDGSSSISRDTRARDSGVESITVSVPGGATATQGSRTYGSVPWGEEIVSETRGTSNAVTTSRDFYTSSDQSGNYARPRSVSTTGGGWEAYEYYDYAGGSADVAGALYKRHRPFKNTDTSVPPNFPQHVGEITTFEYAPDAFGRRTRPTKVETAVGGVVTARSSTSYSDASAGFSGHPYLYLVTATRDDSTADGVTLTTVIKYFREDAGIDTATDDFFRMQTHSVQHPDGRKQSFVYQRGTWGGGSSFTLSGNNGTDYGAASRISIILGNTSTGSSYTAHDGYDLDDLYLVENKSTMEVVIRDAYARLARTETHVWSSGAWQLVSWLDYGYNYANQLVSRTSSNGGFFEAAWSGERKLWEKDETGIKVTFDQYDAASRVQQTTREGGGSIGALTTRFSYNAAHQLTESRAGWGFSENLVTARTFDDAGRLSSETPPGLGATSFSYNPSARSRTASFPDGGARTETFFADGQLEKIEGGAVVAEYFDYAIQSGGVRYTLEKVGSPGSSRLREAWADWLGRPTQTSRPGFSGQPTFTQNFTYNSVGQLTKEARTGYAPTLYAYDALGQIVRSGLDVDRNDTLADASSDRITNHDRTFYHDGSAWWLKEENHVFPFYNDATTKRTSTVLQRLTGFSSGLLSETRTEDAEGNVTTRSVVVDRASKTVTVTTTRTGLNAGTESIVNGFPTSATSPDGLTFTTQYDSLLRTQSVTDPRTGATTTLYRSNSTLPEFVSDAAGQLYSCAYDGLGRKTIYWDAASHVTRSIYNFRGQLAYQWGDGAYPVSFTYNEYGERTDLKTYRSAPAGDSPSWPDVGPADTTTFEYDSPSGLLKKKSDALGRFVEFTYNERGQTHQRFWARLYSGQRVTSTYGYDGSTGELTGVSYNDTTPSVSYSYTRLGQLWTAGDSSTGTHTFNYDGQKPWRLGSISLPDFYGSRVLTALYEDSGLVGRPRGFQLGSSPGSAADLEQAYGFTSGGRFETLASKRANNSVSRTFRYGYLGNSALVENLSIDGHAFNVSRGYEPYRDLVNSIDAKWSTTSRTRYEYTYNGLSQRESQKQSGDVFSDFYDASNTAIFYRYAYSARGELTSAAGYLGNAVTDLSKPLPMRAFEYAHDSAGNRTSSNQTGVAGLQDEYTPNSLNQYAARENNVLAVSGTAAPAPGTKVVVMGSEALAARQGRAWGDAILVGNATGPWQGTVDIYAGKAGSPDLIRKESRTAQLGAFQQGFSHDFDGNLTTDGIWNYQYNAENRLIQMTTTSAATAAGFANRKLEFAYDYANRRVEKKVYNWTEAAGWIMDYTRRYLYDGWNLVMEFSYQSSTLIVQRSYTWGLDLAGSQSATGGVGALLQIHDHTAVPSKTFLPTYDGNGNVASLLNADSGAVEAAYEYSPFGELLRSEGTYAPSNPFRFSTKFTDQETGLVYYGHRYYSPSLGRFINKDPIGEAGGLNLYGFVGNDPVNRVDVLGSTPRDRAGRGGRSIEDPWWWPPWPPSDPFDPWPFDDDDDYDSGPDYPSRYPGVTAPLGPLPRMPFTSVAQGRGDGPYSARRLVYGHSVAPNSAEPTRIRSLEEAHRKARNVLFEKARVSSSNDEDSVLIRTRTDNSGTYYELSEIIEGDLNARSAHISEQASRLVSADRSVVGVAHVHSATGRGRLSGDDIREGIRTGISISAVAVEGEGRGEAEVFIPPNPRGKVPEDAREYARRWLDQSKGKFETFPRGGEDRRFIYAPPGVEKYVPPGSITVIDVGP